MRDIKQDRSVDALVRMDIQNSARKAFDNPLEVPVYREGWVGDPSGMNRAQRRAASKRGYRAACKATSKKTARAVAKRLTERIDPVQLAQDLVDAQEQVPSKSIQRRLAIQKGETE